MSAVDHARTEWGQRWLAALDGLRPSLYKLEKGRTTVRRGDLSDLSIAEGRATARVAVGPKRAVRPTIDVPVIDAGTWRRVIGSLASEVRRSASIVQGELPADLDGVFADAGTTLLPEPTDLGLRCTCPEDGLCLHLSALFFATAREVDRDPLLLLQLRGRSRGDLVAELRSQRSGGDGEDVDPSIVRLADLDADRLQRARGDLGGVVVHPSRDHDPVALLDRLGPPPGFEDVEVVEDLVRAAADIAWRLAAGQGSEAADDEVVLAELRSRRMASAAQVADGLGWDTDRVASVLDRLYEAGTVMRTGSGEGARYRA